MPSWKLRSKKGSCAGLLAPGHGRNSRHCCRSPRCRAANCASTILSGEHLHTGGSLSQGDVLLLLLIFSTLPIMLCLRSAHQQARSSSHCVWSTAPATEAPDNCQSFNAAALMCRRSLNNSFHAKVSGTPGMRAVRGRVVSSRIPPGSADTPALLMLCQQPLEHCLLTAACRHSRSLNVAGRPRLQRRYGLQGSTHWWQFSARRQNLRKHLNDAWQQFRPKPRLHGTDYE